ncbi:MAG TPA: ferritin-like domain-containing protein [Jatrophihabitans sp.]|jgi:hypothetical protein|uniref:ferritin-like domain-containing protein n=1 Tax=Jatrophihabitans sp. TaxID=1932789 RepID=UPI002F01A3ED
MGDDVMDVETVQKQLAIAASQQLGSLVSLTVLAGNLQGPLSIGLKERLQAFAVAEVADAQLLVEKLTAVGGQLAPMEVPPLPSTDAETALREFIEREEQVMAALHAVIPSTGQEPRSEALEHLIEHVLMRKQQQLDYLALVQR